MNPYTTKGPCTSGMTVQGLQFENCVHQDNMPPLPLHTDLDPIIILNALHSRWLGDCWLSTSCFIQLASSCLDNNMKLLQDLASFYHDSRYQLNSHTDLRRTSPIASRPDAIVSVRIETLFETDPLCLSQFQARHLKEPHKCRDSCTTGFMHRLQIRVGGS